MFILLLLEQEKEMEKTELNSAEKHVLSHVSAKSRNTSEEQRRAKKAKTHFKNA